MATVIGKTTVGVALTIIPGSGSGTNASLLRELLQALPDHDWTFGTGDYQLNKWYENITTGLSINSSGSTSLDLNALGGLGGETVNFTKVRILWIYNTSTTSGENFGVAGDFITSRVAATGYTLYPDSCLYVPCPVGGMTVTDDTADTITFANNGVSTNTVKVFIAGQ